MKASFILVLLLVAFSCGGKRKKKPSSGGGFNLKDFFSNRMRTPIPSTPKTTPKTTVKPTGKSSNLNTVVVKNDFNLRDINSTEQFLKVLGVGNKGPQGGHTSSAVVFGFICTLQPTYVEIPDPLKLVPCVVVNRCSGCCLHEYLACKPTHSKKDILSYPRYASSSSASKMSMSVRAGSSFSYEWGTTEIEEHLGCQCGCRDGPSSCNEKQYWDEHNCQCICLDEYKNKKCIGNFKHDPKTCLCKCALKDNGCDSHKKEWSVEECGCVCKKSLGQCQGRTSRDPVTCDCV